MSILRYLKEVKEGDVERKGTLFIRKEGDVVYYVYFTILKTETTKEGDIL